MIQLFQENCQKLLDRIEEQSIDLIYCDILYNMYMDKKRAEDLEYSLWKVLFVSIVCGIVWPITVIVFSLCSILDLVLD